MRRYLCTVLKQLEEHLGDIYMSRGLTLDCRLENKNHLVVSFLSGERTFSPLSLHFYVPETKGRKATLRDGFALIDHYEYMEVSEDGWFKWISVMTSRYNLEGDDQAILRKLRDDLESYRTIYDDDTQPYVLHSEEFAFAHGIVTDYCSHSDIRVERDTLRQSERYVFPNSNGRTVRMEYPFDFWTPATVSVDQEVVGQCRQDDWETLADLVSATLEIGSSRGSDPSS